MTEQEKKWYVIHTYSGFEAKAKLALEERVRSLGMADYFGEVLVPTEDVVEMKNGKKRTMKRKFFPGYMLVQMISTPETRALLTAIPKVTGFVGDPDDLPAVPDHEVERIAKKIDEGTMRPKPKVEFDDGESVRVMEGPFSGFNGIVEVANAEKGKIRVLVSIFGRSTPVELDYHQVEKT